MEHGNTARTPEPTPESLAVTSVFLVLVGDPNEGYETVGLYTHPEKAGDCVRERCSNSSQAALELKWRQIKVVEYRVEDGEFVHCGELLDSELGL
jgi:hypothetical protein